MTSRPLAKPMGDREVAGSSNSVFSAGPDSPNQLRVRAV